MLLSNEATFSSLAFAAASQRGPCPPSLDVKSAGMQLLSAYAADKGFPFAASSSAAASSSSLSSSTTLMPFDVKSLDLTAVPGVSGNLVQVGKALEFRAASAGLGDDDTFLLAQLLSFRSILQEARVSELSTLAVVVVVHCFVVQIPIFSLSRFSFSPSHPLSFLFLSLSLSLCSFLPLTRPPFFALAVQRERAT